MKVYVNKELRLISLPVATLGFSMYNPGDIMNDALGYKYVRHAIFDWYITEYLQFFNEIGNELSLNLKSKFMKQYSGNIQLTTLLLNWFDGQFVEASSNFVISTGDVNVNLRILKTHRTK